MADLLDPADRMLLAEVRAALAVPFRDPVRVGGVLVPRKLARQIERHLVRLKFVRLPSAVGERAEAAA